MTELLDRAAANVQQPQPAMPRQRSPRALAWRRFRANRAAMVSAVVLLIIFAACTVGAFLPPERAEVPPHPENLRHPWPPTIQHPFGTTSTGRDLMIRVLQGGAVSLKVGFAAAAIAIFIGSFYGAVSGLAGGRVDRWMMRLVDVLYGLPYIVLIILLLAVMQRSFTSLFVAIGAFIWLTMARIVRGQVLRLRQEDYVLSARAVGGRWHWLLLRHMLPNLVGPIIVCATLTVPVAILQESFISFLGLGISAPHTSWGQLASEGVKALNPAVTYWWLVLFPCLMLAATLLCLNFLGDGLRDALDPRTEHKD
jgi:oligopeptide transport system permease protein